LSGVANLRFSWRRGKRLRSCPRIVLSGAPDHSSRGVAPRFSTGATLAITEQETFQTFMEGVKRRNSHEPEFVQAVEDVAEDIFGFIADKQAYHSAQILRRIAEPDRVVSFRVCWEDDNGQVRVNRG